MQMFQPGINLIAVTGINESGPVAVIICTREQAQEAAEIIVRHHADTLGLKIDQISLTAKPLMSVARENISQIFAIMQSADNHALHYSDEHDLACEELVEVKPKSKVTFLQTKPDCN